MTGSNRATIHRQAGLIVAAIMVAIATLPALAISKSDMNTFDDTLASGSRPCQGMISVVNLLTDPKADLRDQVYIYWAQAANAAKICSTVVHGETSDAAPSRFPKEVLVTVCARLKAYFLKSRSPYYVAQTSWACGWPSPMPNFRPVPGMMPMQN